MAITLETNARNAAANAIVALVDADVGAANLQIATAGTFSGGEVLAVITLADPAFGSASTGTCTLLGTPLSDTSADNSGIAAFWRIRDNSGDEIMRGPAATSGGGDITLSQAAQQAALNAITTLLDGGDIQLATNSGFGTICVTCPLNADSFANATGNAPATAAMNTSPAVSGTVGTLGTVTAFRMRTSGGTPVLSGTVGTSGTDIVLNTNILTALVTVTINSFTLSQPATSAASDGALVMATTTVTALQQVTITSGSFTQPA